MEINERKAVEVEIVHKEYSAIEPVPEYARNISFTDMLATWIGANANNGSWYVGGVVAGSAFTGALIVTLVANPVAYFIMALIGYIGYKVGTSTMALTRPSFGIRGSYLPSILNITQFIGWTAVNTFIAAISASFLIKDLLGWPAFGEAGGQKTMLVGIGIMSILHLLSIATGRKSIKLVERIGVVFILILGVWETVVVLNHVSLTAIMNWRPPVDKSMPIGAAMDAMAAFSLGWVPAIAEFTRYGRNKNTATVAPMIGANVGLFWFAFVGIIGAIGTAITTGVYDPNNSDPSTIVSKLGLGAVALLIIIITSTTANAVNLMAAGISLTNITKKVKSITALWIVTIATAVITLIPLYLNSFLNTFIGFLDYIGMVFGPIFAIIVVDFYFIHKQKYDTKYFDEKGGKYWYSNGYNLYAIAVWVASVIIYLIIKKIGILNQSIGVTYPVIVIAGVIYYLICKNRKLD
ncbi:cytosine permease [Thermoanaerobacterium butyriciformans]|uniref:Hydroxymethylpyrimidine transporter CytX n=1 Tax=Thermoanaerobacterium butyriciformans TaxID=1702242 RepID=A0ABS4NFF4_9THEO|nr:cytosine permease [Thermoanaerobacterium butyriciformans]MBP2072386.1 putative hydroxymethylpyrimidine transporter CytX [Thermoanaerobacterium butyriciformans]